MKSQPDFIARLEYKTTAEGGRRTPVKSGYRSQVKFYFIEMQSSGQQTFLNKDIVYPGDIVDAEIIVVSPEIFENSLTEGTPFEIREGPTIVGVGQIMRLLNEGLRKPKGFYGGMTTNERLYVSGLSDTYYKAIKEKNVHLIVAILKGVDLTMENIIPILRSEGLDAYDIE